MSAPVDGAAIAMPQLTDSMTDGVVAGWIVADGAAVEAGDAVVDIETEKASVAVEAEADGVLRILVPAGERVAVGTVLASLLPAGTAATVPDPPAATVVPSAAAAPVVAPNGADVGAAPTSRTGPRSDPEPAGRGRVTPLARRTAHRLGVDIEAVAGTGPRGRVVRADVLRAAGAPLPVAAPQEPRPVDGVEIRPLSSLQAVVARRMAEAKETIPHFQVQADAGFDRLLALRADLREAATADVPTINDLIVKAVALSLRDHPSLNASFRGDHVAVHRRVHVGVAVAAEGALIVPTIRDADQLSLGALARESSRLVAAVRDGRPRPEDLDGATFTVSNLGMFGMRAIYPVINPPQAAILGVGATRTELVRGPDGGIEDRQVATLTLSCDHRLVYGEAAARFLADVCRRIESPMGLAL